MAGKLHRRGPLAAGRAPEQAKQAGAGGGGDRRATPGSGRPGAPEAGL